MSLNIVGAIVVGVSLIIGAISTIIIKKRDNAIEQIAEQIIEAKTGIEIDFTPEESEEINKEVREYEACEEVINGNEKFD